MNNENSGMHGRAERYRDLANRIRERAETVMSAEAKGKLLGVAVEYEALAQFVERTVPLDPSAKMFLPARRQED